MGEQRPQVCAEDVPPGHRERLSQVPAVRLWLWGWGGALTFAVSSQGHQGVVVPRKVWRGGDGGPEREGGPVCPVPPSPSPADACHGRELDVKVKVPAPGEGNKTEQDRDGKNG